MSPKKPTRKTKEEIRKAVREMKPPKEPRKPSEPHTVSEPVKGSMDRIGVEFAEHLAVLARKKLKPTEVGEPTYQELLAASRQQTWDERELFLHKIYTGKTKGA
jgi:hypothetical protein